VKESGDNNAKHSSWV